MTPSSKKFLTTSQAAAKFSVHSKTVDRWLKYPGLNFPPPTVVNKRRYYDETQLDKWAADAARRRQ